MDLPVPTGQKSVIPLILLLLLLAVIAFFALGSLNLAGTATQTNPCPPFNEQLEVFRLAQIAEQYRKANPLGVNYGLGSYTVCYTNGKTIAGTTGVARGFNANTPNDQHKTHSEQATYVFLKSRLTGLSLDPGKIAVINVIIFSQVSVCDPCQTDMISWQSGLRQAARSNNLFLSIWDLGSHGFAPGIYPAGNGIPVTLDDLHRVEIAFTP